MLWDIVAVLFFMWLAAKVIVGALSLLMWVSEALEPVRAMMLRKMR
jgi:hypothetical protein